jgi:hypothetical protein
VNFTKKKVISLIILTIFSICLIGCGADDELKERQSQTNTDRFIPTGDIYKIGKYSYYVYYDNITNIVYIQSSDTHSSGITQLIGSDKLPMTLDEYNKNK